MIAIIGAMDEEVAPIIAIIAIPPYSDRRCCLKAAFSQLYCGLHHFFKHLLA